VSARISVAALSRPFSGSQVWFGSSFKFQLDLDILERL